VKFLIMYAAIIYVVACADDVKEPGDSHPWLHRIVRAVVWPLTITSWFRSQNIRLHRLLNILWAILIGGWFLSLMADKL
jgi:hypothetical protein